MTHKKPLCPCYQLAGIITRSDSLFEPSRIWFRPEALADMYPPNPTLWNLKHVCPETMRDSRLMWAWRQVAIADRLHELYNPDYAGDFCFPLPDGRLAYSQGRDISRLHVGIPASMSGGLPASSIMLVVQQWVESDPTKEKDREEIKKLANELEKALPRIEKAFNEGFESAVGQWRIHAADSQSFWDRAMPGYTPDEEAAERHFIGQLATQYANAPPTPATVEWLRSRLMGDAAAGKPPTEGPTRGVLVQSLCVGQDASHGEKETESARGEVIQQIGWSAPWVKDATQRRALAAAHDHSEWWGRISKQLPRRDNRASNHRQLTEEDDERVRRITSREIGLQEFWDDAEAVWRRENELRKEIARNKGGEAIAAMIKMSPTWEKERERLYSILHRRAGGPPEKYFLP